MCANPWNGWHGWLLQREKNWIYLAYIQLRISKTKNIYPCTLRIIFFFSIVRKYFIRPSWPAFSFSFPFRLSKAYFLTTASVSRAHSMFQEFLYNCLLSEDLISLYQVSYVFGSLSVPYCENSQTMTLFFFFYLFLTWGAFELPWVRLWEFVVCFTCFVCVKVPHPVTV